MKNNKMEKQALSSKAKLVIGLTIVGVILFFAFITICVVIGKSEDEKFLKDGIRVEATVNALHSYGTNKNMNYKMDISMFTKAPDKTIIKTDTAGKSKSEKEINDFIDNLIINHRSGNYMGLTINCNAKSYSKYRPGDKITVVYLKEDSTKVRVLSELE